jgi:hypothetical protein
MSTNQCYVGVYGPQSSQDAQAAPVTPEPEARAARDEAKRKPR